MTHDERKKMTILEMLADGISMRGYNCLTAAGVETVGDLIAKTPDELLLVKNLGEGTLSEIVVTLASYGLALREPKARSFVITFGQGHLFGWGHHYYVTVTSPSESLARRRAHAIFGTKWSMIYAADAWTPAHGEQCLGHIAITDENQYAQTKSTTIR